MFAIRTTHAVVAGSAERASAAAAEREGAWQTVETCFRTLVITHLGICAGGTRLATSLDCLDFPPGCEARPRAGRIRRKDNLFKCDRKQQGEWQQAGR